MTRYSIPRTPPPDGYFVTVNKGPILATDHRFSATNSTANRDVKAPAEIEKISDKEKAQGPSDAPKNDKKDQPDQAVTAKDDAAKKKEGAGKENAAQRAVNTLKAGNSTSKGILGLVAWGDSTIHTAAKNAGITRIRSVDYERVLIQIPIPYYGTFKIYEAYTVIVSGE